jgi:hypothetical protein
MGVSMAMEEWALAKGAKVQVRPDFFRFVGESETMKFAFQRLSSLSDNDSKSCSGLIPAL